MPKMPKMSKVTPECDGVYLVTITCGKCNRVVAKLESCKCDAGLTDDLVTAVLPAMRCPWCHTTEHAAVCELDVARPEALKKERAK